MNETTVKPGSDLYYSWLFLDKNRKQTLYALETLLQTLSAMTQLKEDDVFQVKSAWWQQEITRMFNQQATHPDTIALQALIEPYQIPTIVWQEYLQGIQVARQMTHCCSEEDFVTYSQRTYGVKQMLYSYVYGFRSPATLQYCRALGHALCFMDQIIYIGHHLRKESILLPLSLNIDWPTLSSQDWKTVLQQQNDQALAALQSALSSLPSNDATTQYPSLIAAKLKRKQLQLAQNDFSSLQHTYPELTPIRKYCLTWWWMRKSNR